MCGTTMRPWLVFVVILTALLCRASCQGVSDVLENYAEFRTHWAYGSDDVLSSHYPLPRLRLAELCEDTPGCVAFSSDGNLLLGFELVPDSQLVHADTWVTWLLSNASLFVQQTPSNWQGVSEPPSDPNPHVAQLPARVQEFAVEQQVSASTSPAYESNPDYDNDYESNYYDDDSYYYDTTPDSSTGLFSATQKAPPARIETPDRPFFDSRRPQYTGGRNWVCPARSQGGCGTCVSFSLMAAAESAIASALGQDCKTSLSPQFLFFCAPPWKPTCQSGWDPDTAMSVLITHGVLYDKCMPYDRFKPSAAQCVNKCNSSSRSNGAYLHSPSVNGPGGTWQTVAFSNRQISKAKDWIAKHGAVVTAFTVSKTFYLYKSGIFNETKIDSARLSHATAVVGWNDTGRYWIGKNSWGTRWGYDGFFKISYSHPNFMKKTVYGVQWRPSSSPFPPPPPSRPPKPPPPRRNPPKLHSTTSSKKHPPPRKAPARSPPKRSPPGRS